MSHASEKGVGEGNEEGETAPTRTEMDKAETSSQAELKGEQTEQIAQVSQLSRLRRPRKRVKKARELLQAKAALLASSAPSSTASTSTAPHLQASAEVRNADSVRTGTNKESGEDERKWKAGAGGFRLLLLPHDALLKIASFCGVERLCTLSMVSRELYMITNEDYLWRNMYLRRWENPPVGVDGRLAVSGEKRKRQRSLSSPSSSSLPLLSPPSALNPSEVKKRGVDKGSLPTLASHPSVSSAAPPFSPYFALGACTWKRRYEDRDKQEKNKLKSSLQRHGSDKSVVEAFMVAHRAMRMIDEEGCEADSGPKETEEEMIERREATSANSDHKCTRACIFVEDPKRSNIYECKQSGLIHVCGAQRCREKVPADEGYVVCPFSGQCFPAEYMHGEGGTGAEEEPMEGW
mmetsp:Transcript_5996/g.14561  ORF Transcript_5996/g.14561 Transcript_5996/m.14561 type:complete len:407 (-) Transcript_5996:818-2038(-)|eukprot:CAMPEP_0113918714 /NCGR_PEP_ID=MMETSP0780_2-20120614/33517_1 /TAXON_ID=652834 /ORGANISM="Palpitomonas bilix" /LENGTH=406 /DNA_ID=CAMNT_0000918577 /DNA_START=185 /DNA_END=1402 /DNA_ORIENTATION=+ /assembly_acc=CAM_ASM_000599